MMSENSNEITATQWLEKAKEAEDNDDTANALEAVDEALKLDPTLGEAWCLKASLLQDMDKPQEAFKILNEACQRLPHDAGCWFEIGAFLATHDEIPQAVKCYIRAYGLDNKYPRVRTNLGQAFLTVHDFGNAVKLLTEALEENTSKIDRARILNFLAEAHIALNEFDKAYECLDESLTLNENDYAALANMAMVHLQRKQPDAARATIEEAIEKDPKNANLFIMKAAIYDAGASNEDHDIANKAIKSALELAPEDPNIWIKVANRNVHFKQIDKAITCLEKATKIAPNNYQVWHSQGYLLSQIAGKEEVAIASLDRSNKLNPAYPGNWLVKAQIYHRLNRLEDAAYCQRCALHLTGRLVIWGLFLVDENKQPVPDTQIAIETESNVPHDEVVKQFIERLKKEGREVDEKGIVDGKYRVGLTRVPFREVADKPFYKDGEDPKSKANA